MDMTKDSVKKSLLYFAAPIILSLITQQLYNLSDAIIVGRFLGHDVLSAVGNAGTVISVFTIICGGFEMGSEIIFSKYWGEKEYEKIRIGSKQIFLFALLSAIGLSAACLIFQERLFTSIHLPKELFADTQIYFSIYASGLIIVFGFFISNAIILALGNSKIVLHLSLITSVLNIILDLLMIGLFHWGAAGAAIATILAQLVGLIASLYCLKKYFHTFPKQTTEKQTQKGILKEILCISFPSMIQQFVLTFAALLLQSLVNTFGTDIVSGYVVIDKLSSLGLVPVIGVAQAVSMFSSMNFGAKKIERIKQCYLFSVTLSLLYLILLDFTYVWKADLLVSLFLQKSKSIIGFEFACHYLRCSIVTYFIVGVEFVNESLLRSLGRMKGFLFSSFGHLSVRIGVSYVLAGLIGTEAFWIGDMIGRMTAVIISGLLIYLMTKQVQKSTRMQRQYSQT